MWDSIKKVDRTADIMGKIVTRPAAVADKNCATNEKRAQGIHNKEDDCGVT